MVEVSVKVRVYQMNSKERQMSCCSITLVELSDSVDALLREFCWMAEESTSGSQRILRAALKFFLVVCTSFRRLKGGEDDLHNR